MNERAIREAMRPLVIKMEDDVKLTNAERAELRVLGRELRLAQEAREIGAAADREHGDSSSPTTNGSEERAMLDYLRTGRAPAELRAAGEATGTAGGYLVPPGWWQRLQVALKSFGGMEQDYQPLPTNTGAPMQWATNNPTGVVGSLLAENTTVPTQDYVFRSFAVTT